MNPCYQKNLATLRKTHRLLYEQIASLPVPVWTVKSNDQGQNFLYSTGSEQPSLLGEIFDTAENEHKIEAILQHVKQGCDFYYFFGMGSSALFETLVSHITSENRGILIVEPNVDAFLVALALYDFGSCFRNQRVFWVIGANAKEQIDALFDKTLCYAAAKPYIYAIQPNIPKEAQETRDDLVAFIRDEIKDRKQFLATFVKQLPQKLLQHRDERSKVWSFLDIRGKARYSLIQHVLIRTIFHYLQRLGYETEYTVLEDGKYYPPYYRIYKMALFEPHIIFLCNMGPAYDMMLGAELSRSLPIPKVVWFADDPLYGEHLLERHKITADEHYIVADYGWGDILRKHGAQQTHFMAGAATRTRRGKKRGQRKCDVVFVGQVRSYQAFFAKLTPAWQRYCQQVIVEKLRSPRKNVRDVMEQFEMPSRLEEDQLDLFRQKLLWEANTRYRLLVIQRLAKYDLKIYGNDNWRHLLPPELTKRCFGGVLRFKHLFEVYRNARIVINIHSLQSYTCMNVRDFDVPAAGGFLISDWLPKADEIYVPGFVDDIPLDEKAKQEIFFYRNLDEIQPLVDYFLAHEDERLACIERAREKIASGHTYKHRTDYLHQLFQSLPLPK